MVESFSESEDPVPEVSEAPRVFPDRADHPVSETTERFLRFIVDRVPLSRIEEIHLFSPLRQGTMETGVAVIAARVVEVEEGVEVELDGVVEPENLAESESVVEPEEVVEHAPKPIERHTVYTARYRHTIKGPERGKWEPDVVEEADAPLITVETVVRGVQRRAGEDSEIIRFTGAQVARALRIAPDTPPAG